jgi:hypothetical protein
MWSNFIFTLLLATPTLGGALQQHAPRVDDTEWRNVKCDHGALGSAQSDPFVMWNDAKATEGWSDCYEEYINNRSSIGFSNFVADYFHARPNINCGALDNANCEVTVNCGQSTSESAPINSPAG